MTTTKPSRQRPSPARRMAPHYTRPDADTYAALPADEKHRADLHADVDTIIDARPHARIEHDAYGSASNRRPMEGSRSNDAEALSALESWSQHHDVAGDWLAEQTEAVAALTRVARMAANNGWRTLPAGTVTDGVKVGGRNPTTAWCAWCGEAIPPGRSDITGNSHSAPIDGQPVHRSTCYYQIDRRARAAGIRVGPYLAQHLAQKAKAPEHDR